MRTRTTEVEGALILEPQVFTDARGFVMEIWHAEKFRLFGIDLYLVQENHSRSVEGTLRGLHYQSEQPQGKLVRVVQGSVFDVAVDLRRSSPTFRRWAAAELSADNRRMFWIPPGCAHGFLATSSSTDVVYLCTELYAPAHDCTLKWDDPELAIPWPLQGRVPLLSAKDAQGVALRQAPLFP